MPRPMYLILYSAVCILLAQIGSWTYQSLPASSEAARLAYALEVLFLIQGLVILYFLPYLIALHRVHNDAVLIGLLDSLFGWTILLWVLLIIWAASPLAIRRQR